MSHRRTAAAACGLLAFVLVGGVAHASGAAVLGAAATVVTPCTDAGVHADIDLDGMMVRSVTVSGLPAACLGQSVSVTLGQSAGPAVEASGRVTGSVVSLEVARGLDARDVSELAVALQG
jgi:hypothetical protein